MKRFLLLFLFLTALAAAAIFSIRPVILSVARSRILQALPGSTVSIKSCAFLPLRQLRLTGIDIHRGTVYHLKIPEITADYSIPSLLQRNLPRVTVNGMTVDIHAPDKKMGALGLLMKSGPQGTFSIHDLILSDMALDIQSKDLKLSVRGSAGLNVTTPAIDSIDMKIASFQYGEVQMRHGALQFGSKQDKGEFAVENVRYDKAEIKDIHGMFRLEEGTVFLDFLSARIFNGRLEGHVSLTLVPVVAYLAEIDITDLDVGRFISDFNLNEKFSMSGDLSGRLVLKGTGTQVQALSGDFSTVQPGGTLVIKDTRFLERIAGQTRQPVDILVENFKNYHYNTGRLELSLDQGNLILDIALDGEEGKRDLSVVVHDFVTP